MVMDRRFPGDETERVWKCTDCTYKAVSVDPPTCPNHPWADTEPVEVQR